MEFSKLNECPLDPGTERLTRNESYHSNYSAFYFQSNDLHAPFLENNPFRGLFYCERSGESHSDPRTAVKKSNNCGAGQEGSSRSLSHQVL